MTIGQLDILFCGYMYSKNPLLLGDRPLHSLSGIFWWKEILNFKAVHFIKVFFNVTAFCVLFKKYYLFWGHESSHLCFLLKAELLYLLHLDLQPIWNELLCVVWVRDLILLFYFSIWIFNRLSIIYWRVCPFSTVLHLCLFHIPGDYLSVGLFVFPCTNNTVS